MNERMLTEAIEWRIRLRDADEDMWPAFTAWLEGEPGRSDAYDRVALADLDLDEVALPPAQPVALPIPMIAARAPRRPWRLALPAITAAAIVVLLLVQQPQSGPAPYVVVTAPGQHRVIALAGDGSVALNGATRLILDRQDSRTAELQSGEALFRIRHDPAHPFQLKAGDHVVRDLGTLFDVSRDGARLSVGVVSGSVVLDPEGASVALAAGQRAEVEGQGTPVVTTTDSRSIGGWHRGQLDYAQAPLAAVVAQLSRTTGVRIALDPALASLPFTGSIHVEPDRAAMMHALAAALGVDARNTRQGWTIEPRGRAHR